MCAGTVYACACVRCAVKWSEVPNIINVLVHEQAERERDPIEQRSNPEDSDIKVTQRASS